MSDCTPSTSTEEVTHTASPCKELCAGVTFAVEWITTGNDDRGDCTFDWSVARTKDGVSTSLPGSTTLACGSSKTIDLHCDPGGSCVGFRIHLECADG